MVVVRWGKICFSIGRNACDVNTLCSVDFYRRVEQNFVGWGKDTVKSRHRSWWPKPRENKLIGGTLE